MPIDASKLRANLNKKSISTELSKPNFFLHTGNYALNQIIMGQYGKGFPNRRTLMLAGESGTGKSFMACNIAKRAQDNGYFTIYVDSEDAIDPEYMEKIGLSMDEDKFMPIRAHTIEQVAESFNEILKMTGEDDKIMLVIDSLANLSTDAEAEEFAKSGKLTNDMGLKAKKQKQLLKDINYYAGERDMFTVMTNHVYVNQDIRNGKGTHIITGGEGQLYIPSVTLMIKKKKLREDDNTKAESNVNGIEIVAEAYKTRFNKPHGRVTIKVPYDTGMDPFSGLVDLLVDDGILTASGAWYKYIDKDTGEEKKFQGKDAIKNHVQHIIDVEDFDATKIKEDFSQENPPEDEAK